MIEKFRCTCCKISYEISWEDNESIYYSGVEDEDDETYPDELDPEYCPFCGSHISYAGEEDDETYV